MRLMPPWSVDLRSLAAFRMLLAAGVLLDVVVRVAQYDLLYGPNGLLPERTRDATYFQHFTLLSGLGTDVAVPVALGLSLVLAVMLLVGRHSRLVALALFCLVVSYQVRNPAILSGGDWVVRILLLIAAALPIGARWSLDRAYAPEFLRTYEQRTETFFGPGALALSVQMGAVYLMSALYKTGPVWLEGRAAEVVLASLYARDPYAQWMLGLGSEVLTPLTYAVLAVELLGGLVLLLVPVIWLRGLAVALLILMHMGFTLGLNVGLFPFFCVTGLIGLLPGAVWRGLSTGRGVTVYYDGACGFCHRMARRVLALAGAEDARLIPAQDDETARSMLPQSWTVRAGGADTHRGAALLRVMDHSVFAGVAFLLRPFTNLLDGLYDRVAASRDRLGRWEGRPRLSIPHVRQVSAGLGSVLVAFLVWQNAGLYLGWIDDRQVTRLNGLGLYHKWSMFAPNPGGRRGYVVAVMDAEDRPVDLVNVYLAGGRGEWREVTMPSRLNGIYGGGALEYWTAMYHKFMENVYADARGGGELARVLGQQLCIRAQQDHLYGRGVKVMFLHAEPQGVRSEVLYEGDCVNPQEREGVAGVKW